MVKKGLNWTAQKAWSELSRKAQSGRSQIKKWFAREIDTERSFWIKVDGPKNDTDLVMKVEFMH